MIVILKLVASVFIKLDFARNMDAAASNVEEMALEEMSQYPMGSPILISISLSAGSPLFSPLAVFGLFQIPPEQMLIFF